MSKILPLKVVELGIVFLKGIYSNIYLTIYSLVEVSIGISSY